MNADAAIWGGRTHTHTPAGEHFLVRSPWLCLSVQVSATFAASLVTSPAIGAYLSVAYGDTLVVILATAIALLDICFILVAVPESLPEKMRPASWGAPISWEQADPFAVSNNFILFGWLENVALLPTLYEKVPACCIS